MANQEVTYVMMEALNSPDALNGEVECVSLDQWLFKTRSVHHEMIARAVGGQLGRYYDRLHGETSFACVG